MKNKPLISGIIAAASPLPLAIFTVLWSWLLGFGLVMGVLGYDQIPISVGIVSILPLLISPLLGLGGILHGIIKRKERLAWLGIILSVLCLVENFLLIYGMIYLGSIA